MLDLELALLNCYQRNFPLVPRPFDVLARELGTSPERVLRTLAMLKERRIVSRIGATFRPNTVGASVLGALAVPEDRLEAVAGMVSGYPEITHNYEREHRYNLWFVATAPNEARLSALVQEIELRARLPLLELPLLEDYHIDLGFDLAADGAPGRCPSRRSLPPRPHRVDLDGPAHVLVEGLQRGLPLTERPYAALGEAAGIEEEATLARLRDWLAAGVIQRLGVIVHHHELGYRANAMVVWDVPEAELPQAVDALLAWDFVTLCYRRPRRPPDWPYNLFCMIHGRDRNRVLERVELLAESDLDRYPHEVLFSRRRFKQREAPRLDLETTDG
ncbi:MAG: heme biosynthesis protein [Burkholderiales bacterium]|nr:MAG: heme biosynthesis protein [Burkholderiales bacterium]